MSSKNDSLSIVRAGLTSCTLLVLFLSTPAWAQVLRDIDYKTLPGNNVIVNVLFDETAPEPKSFFIESPARIVLDFPDTTLGMENRVRQIGVGIVDQIMAIEAGGRTRVVVSLFQNVPYQISHQDNAVNVSINSVVTTSDESQAQSVRERLGGDSAVDGRGVSGPHLQDIEFSRGQTGEGLVRVKLSSPSISMNVNQVGTKLIVEFPATSLPADLDRRLDVIDFATPISVIDTRYEEASVVMTLDMTSVEYDYLAYQADTDLTIEVTPLTKRELEEKKKDQFAYTGERLSLNFQDIEVRAVLQLLADFTDFNLVTSDTVGGNVTLRLKNVPWDQAMDIILKTRGLGRVEEGNVVLIAPQEELAARERLRLEASKHYRDLEALSTRYIQINYASASDLAALISGEGNQLLSERGNVAVDRRTNTLIIQDVSTSLDDVQELIIQLDVPIKQVLIEARIVTADVEFTRDLGVRFGYSRQVVNSDGTVIGFGGTQPGTVTYNRAGSGGEGEAVCTGFCLGSEAEGYLVSLPVIREGATAGTAALAIGKLGSWLLQLELSALINEGRAQTLANPKIITVNQGEAVIETGTEIPYQQASSSGATSVSFRRAVLGMTVVPQITPDDRVLLNVTVTRDAPGNIDVLGTPTISTNRLQTQVLVEDGETVVLGGVFEDNSDSNFSRIPFFGDLPYVGFLFRRRGQQSRKNELLIFITPKILGDRI